MSGQGPLTHCTVVPAGAPWKVTTAAVGVLGFDGGGSLDTSFSGDGVTLLRYSDRGGDRADFARDLILRPDGRVTLLGQGIARAPLPAHGVALLGVASSGRNRQTSMITAM